MNRNPQTLTLSADDVAYAKACSAMEIALLERAKALIAKPEAWLHEEIEHAVDAESAWVNTDDPSAVQWSMAGALDCAIIRTRNEQREAGTLDEWMFEEAMNAASIYLEAAVYGYRETHPDCPRWADGCLIFQAGGDDYTTHALVMQWFENAIHIANDGEDPPL